MHNAGMIYGYARVSTGAQDLTGQLAQLKAAGCEKVFREKITGTTADRPQLKKLMAALAPGDVVIIPAVDRLSRDTTDLLVIAREMQRAGAGIRSLAEPFLDTTSDFAEMCWSSASGAGTVGTGISRGSARPRSRLALVIGGYTWRGVQDRDATTALRQCYDAAMQDKATGRRFCQLDLIRP